MNININSTEVFIPETNGNDKAESPITFKLQFLTAEDQSEIEYFEYVHVGNGKNPRMKVKVNNPEIFRRGVVSIDNFSVNGEKVDTAEKFMAIRGPKWISDMILEVSVHLKKAMEIDSKN